ncbi:MAG: YchJ family metal-binding protein [Polyangiales bacterium]
MVAPRQCPCHSGQQYEECCAPFHKKTQEPPTPEKMMRSRYSAFALKLVPYLYDTFHSTHEDRKLPRNEVLRGLRDAAEGFRYMGLQILDTRTDEANGIAWVLFNARLFERGQNRSFVELSTFKKEDGGWRYSDGVTVPLSLVKDTVDTLTIDTFPKKKGAA